MLHLNFLCKYLLTKLIVTEDKWSNLHLDPVFEKKKIISAVFMIEQCNNTVSNWCLINDLIKLVAFRMSNLQHS